METYKLYNPSPGPSRMVQNREKENFFDRYFNDGNEEEEIQFEETEIYFREACTRIKEKDDLLIYWKSNSSRFPVLAKMVTDFLAIPASSSAIESQFSTAGHLYSKRRNRMKPDTLEMLVLLHDWQKNLQ